MGLSLPDTGDIVWLQFDPQAGHEQAGHRPALVLSHKFITGNLALSFVAPWLLKSKATHLKWFAKLMACGQQF